MSVEDNWKLGAVKKAMRRRSCICHPQPKKKDSALKQEVEDTEQAKREGTEEITGKVGWN